MMIMAISTQAGLKARILLQSTFHLMLTLGYYCGGKNKNKNKNKNPPNIFGLVNDPLARGALTRVNQVSKKKKKQILSFDWLEAPTFCHITRPFAAA